VLNKGIQAVFEKNSTLPSNYVIQNFLKQYSETRAYKVHKIENEKFLAENAKKDGVQILPSGLQYVLLIQETRPKPAAHDTVIVHYIGCTIDGFEFDNSYKKGEPAVFHVSSVIKGLTEGIQLMNIGSKYKFFIPYQLGYGETWEPHIKPYSTLVYEVELLAIKPAD
jgi:FKBP-type peptidyl-prolyl cis-trans isomerase